MSVRLQYLTPDDWRRWRDVRARALAADPAAFACSAHQLGAHTPEAQWRDALAHRQVLVAVDEGRDVAMVGLAWGEEPELVSMWVAPEARGRGLGRRLVEAVLALAGDRPVVLRVMVGNDPACDLYARCGFVLVRRAPDDEGTLTMRRAASRAADVWPPPAARPLRPGAPLPGPTADQ